MPRVPNHIKSIILIISIALGLTLNAERAHAATETAIVAGGCFWCVESDFESVPGVISVVSGYTGGHTANPTYKQVGKGNTGHLESVKIKFNTSKISYAQIVNMFLRSIDVTDAGGQFCDRGKQYSTAIFYQNAAQKATANAEIAKARAELGRRIVTPVRAASRFYPAEDYHQNYYRGTNFVINRAGPKRQSSAYKFYRKSCGRDAKVRQLWGSAAPFANH